MHDFYELLRAAESSGETFLKLCQILHSQGINLAAQSHLQQIISQIETSISAKPANQPCSVPSQPQQIPVTEPECAKHIEPSPLFLADPEYANLIKPGPLRPGDYRIDQINGSQYLQQLQKALRNHTARAEFPVGTVIPDIWTDRKTGAVYSMPLIIVDYRNVQTAQCHDRFGAILLRQNALPQRIVFDKEGVNVFGQSDLRSWLNRNRDYLEGCSTNLLRATVEVIVDNLVLRFFPPSAEEMHFNPKQTRGSESLAWKYFRDTPTDVDAPCPKRVIFDLNGTANICWLRSANHSVARSQYCISKSGSLDYHDVCSCRYVAPACVVAV